MSEKMRDGIVQRGKTWSYVVRERDPETGKTKPRWVSGFASVTAAKKARNAARAEVDNGTYVAPQDVTVGAWLDQWIIAHETQLKPSTAYTYRANITRYLKPTIGHERVQSLSPNRLSRLFRELHESGGKDSRPLSTRTVQFCRAVLHGAMEDALLERVIQVNPVVGSKTPKRDGKPQHNTWTGEQLKTFLAHVEGTRWAALWTLAAGTGLRRGELMGLRWDDVDLEAGIVSVERSTTQIGKERVTSTPKNHEKRKVSIDPQTIATIRAWRVIQARERLEFGPAYEDVDGFVFTWENGSPVQPDYVTKSFGKAQRGIDLPRLTVHELRHSHLTILQIRAGVPVHIVSKRAGHKDPSVTLNVYAHAIPDDDDRAVDIYSKAVWGA